MEQYLDIFNNLDVINEKLFCILVLLVVIAFLTFMEITGKE